MSYAPGAPPEVWAIPTSRVDGGAKWTLALAWSKADHDIQQDPRPTTIWFAWRHYPEGHARAGERMGAAGSRDITISERTGAKVSAIQRHWTKLRKIGLADANGRCVDLRTPSEFFDQSPRGVDQSPRTSVDAAKTTVDAARTSVDAAKTSVDVQFNPPVPPSPPSPGEDARARPTPPAHQPLESGRMLATGKPATAGPSSRPTRPDPPGETSETSEARHARLAGQRAAQAELDREAELAAEPGKPRMGGLPIAVLDAIAAAPGSWHRELESTAKGGRERETWCEALARAIAERGTDRLTPEAIGRVLVARDKLKGRERDAIPRREIWWSKHWDWAARHVDQRPEAIDWRLVPRPPGEFK